MGDLVFLGPPGAGKGTQAKKVAGSLGVPHLSTGDLLRAAVREGTALGREAKGYLDQGKLVPDSLVDRMVAEKLASKDCESGFLLDGYPRNLAQAEKLDSIQAELERSLSAAVLIEVPDSLLLERLTGRRSCPKCGAMYHVTGNPPRTPGQCDGCGSALVVRSDDRPEVVQQRLEVYHRETRPLIEYYRGQGLLRSVDGAREIEQVTRSVLELLRQA